MGAIKLPEGRGPRPLHGAERRPVGEKIAGLDGRDLADPVERLRKILLQQTGDPVGQGHALIHEFRRCSQSACRVRLSTVSGTHARSLSRWRTTRSSRSSESSGSSFAPLVRKASRYAPAPSG